MPKADPPLAENRPPVVVPPWRDEPSQFRSDIFKQTPSELSLELFQTKKEVKRHIRRVSFRPRTIFELFLLI